MLFLTGLDTEDTELMLFLSELTQGWEPSAEE